MLKFFDRNVEDNVSGHFFSSQFNSSRFFQSILENTVSQISLVQIIKQTLDGKKVFVLVPKGIN